MGRESRSQRQRQPHQSVGLSPFTPAGYTAPNYDPVGGGSRYAYNYDPSTGQGSYINSFGQTMNYSSY